jgi:tetratricopeptide (TPR) repeat protein
MRLGVVRRFFERRALLGKLAALPPLLASGKHAEAEAAATEALALAEAAHGADAPEIVTPLYVQAASRLALGLFDQALAPCLRAIAVAESAAGTPTEPRLPKLLELCAAIHERAGSVEEAVRVYRRLLAGHERMRAPDEAAIAEVANRLGLLLGKQKSVPEARLFLSRSLTTWERVAGARSREAAEVLYNLGTVELGAGKREEALRLLERAAAIAEERGEAELLASALHNLGVIAEERGQRAEAAALYKRSIAAREQASGPLATALRPTLVRLGKLHEVEGRTAEAAALYARALPMAEQELSAEHPITQGIRAFLKAARGEGTSGDH